MGHMGAVMGHACAHIWAIYGSIYEPHGSSNGACMRAYMGHIWGQPYPGREEGNSRESLPFPGLGKGITLGLSLPYSAA